MICIIDQLYSLRKWASSLVSFNSRAAYRIWKLLSKLHIFHKYFLCESRFEYERASQTDSCTIKCEANATFLFWVALKKLWSSPRLTKFELKYSYDLSENQTRSFWFVHNLLNREPFLVREDDVWKRATRVQALQLLRSFQTLLLLLINEIMHFLYLVWLELKLIFQHASNAGIRHFQLFCHFSCALPCFTSNSLLHFPNHCGPSSNFFSAATIAFRNSRLRFSSQINCNHTVAFKLTLRVMQGV